MPLEHQHPRARMGGYFGRTGEYTYQETDAPRGQPRGS
jgi:hypothetical protein